MEHVWKRYDAGGGERVDNIIKDEYNIILNLAGMYMPIRDGWWIISLTRFIAYVSVLLYGCYIFYKTASYTMHDMNLAAQSAHYAVFAVISIIILVCVAFYRSKVNELMIIIGDNFYKYQHFEEPKELQTWKNESRNTKVKLLILVPVFALLTVVMIIGGPTYDTLLGYSTATIMDNIDTRLPVKIWHPHSKESTVTYWCYLIYQLIGGGIGASIIGFSAVFMIFICIAVILQLKILKNSLSLIKERASYRHKCIYPNIKLNNESMAECLLHCIKENVEHHNVIIRAFELIHDIASIPTGSGLYVGSIILALSCLAFILGDSTPSTYITSILLLIWELANQAMLCYFGQQISDESLEIQDVLYKTDWTQFPKEATLSLRIIRERVKQPLLLKAFGLTPLTYETFSKVINTAYSYFNILLAAKDNGF